MADKPYIIGFGGTTRAHSSSERLVAAVLAEIEVLGGRTVLLGGDKLAALPHYAPEHAERTPGQVEFVEAIRRADGIVIGSPSYHGGISGLVKNAIDLIADLQKDRRVFLDGRPVGLVVAAGLPQWGWPSIPAATPYSMPRGRSSTPARVTPLPPRPSRSWPLPGRPSRSRNRQVRLGKSRPFSRAQAMASA